MEDSSNWYLLLLLLIFGRVVPVLGCRLDDVKYAIANPKASKVKRRRPVPPAIARQVLPVALITKTHRGTNTSFFTFVKSRYGNFFKKKKIKLINKKVID